MPQKVLSTANSNAINVRINTWKLGQTIRADTMTSDLATVTRRPGSKSERRYSEGHVWLAISSLHVW